MGIREKIGNRFNSEQKPSQELIAQDQEVVQFKDLEVKEKAVKLLVAVDENILRINQNQQVLETEYIPRLSGFTRTLGGNFDTNNVETALFYDKLLNAWIERRVTLQKVMDLINVQEKREVDAKNSKKDNLQLQINLEAEKTWREKELFEGRKELISDSIETEFDPVAERKFLNRLAYGLGRKALQRTGVGVAEHSKRCNDIRDDLMPMVHIDNKTQDEILSDVTVEKSKLSKRLDTLKYSFDELYNEQLKLMQRFDEEIRGLHGMIEATHNGMLPPMSVVKQDGVRQISAPARPRQITSEVFSAEISSSTQESYSTGSFLDDIVVNNHELEQVRE